MPTNIENQKPKSKLRNYATSVSKAILHSVGTHLGLYLLAMLIIGGGLIACGFFEHKWSFTEFLTKLGDAFVVAAAIAFVVDRAAKRELLEEFLHDVSAHFIGHLLPRGVRDDVISYLSLEFVRKHWDVVYTIAPIKAHPGFVEMATESTYKILNVTKRDLVYKYRFIVDRSWWDHVGESRITKITITPEDGDAEVIGPDKLKRLVERDDLAFKFERNVEIPSGKWVEFKSACVEFYRDSFDAPFISQNLVESADIEVRFPSNELRVFVYSSVDYAYGTDHAKVDELPDRCIWHMNKPLLPGQCIFTRWEPLPAVAESTQPTTPKPTGT